MVDAGYYAEVTSSQLTGGPIGIVPERANRKLLRARSRKCPRHNRTYVCEQDKIDTHVCKQDLTFLLAQGRNYYISVHPRYNSEGE